MKNPTLQKTIGVLAASLALACTAKAQIVLNSTDRGWYDSTGFHTTNNDNYAAGLFSNLEFRNFFVFDLGAVTGTILSAELRIFSPGSSFQSNDARETLSLFDTSTSIASLTNGTAGMTAFNDLGSGTLLGSTQFSAANDGAFTAISLNASAISLLQGAIGNSFALGGALSTLGNSADQLLFATSGDFDFSPTDIRLSLVTSQGNFTPVPEPSTYNLIGAIALLGIVVLRRRRATAK